SSPRVSNDSSTPAPISLDCSSILTITPHVSASIPYSAFTYPISRNVSLTILGISTYALVVISPVTYTTPVVTITSHATLASLSFSNISSNTASEILSAILSG